jgi:hypothetical protein
MNARSKDPTMQILNDYLDAHPASTWEENVVVLRLLLWLRDQGHLKLEK